MPFPDEVKPVEVVNYRATWADDYQDEAGRLRSALHQIEAVICHVGSTSVPGLAAKDVIDVQIEVYPSDFEKVRLRLSNAGWRQRHERWNQAEDSTDGPTPKMVFAPAAGARPTNVHVRAMGGQTARTALLFHEYLMANTSDRDSWSHFKRRLADEVKDLAAYGQIKAHPWAILMRSAERWASETGWTPSLSAGGAALPANTERPCGSAPGHPGTVRRKPG